MQAETPNVELNLPQAFLLLATNDKDGKPDLPTDALRATVAGAILAELELIGAIRLQGKHVRATGAAPRTDLQHELEFIRGKSRPHTPKSWVSMLEGRAAVHRVYEGMVSKGILEHAGEKHLGLFRAVRYPEKDHAPEAEVLKKIQDALSGAPSGPGTSDPGSPGPNPAAPDTAVPDATAPDVTAPDVTAPGVTAPDAGTPAPAKPHSTAPEARTMALIALLHAAGLLRKLFPAADLSRATELAKDYWPARAVEEELLMMRLAQEENPAL